MKKTKKITIILIILFVLLVFISYVIKGFLKSYIIEHDHDLLLELANAIRQTSMDMDKKWDTNSICEYNKLFDEEEHCLHEIDENTEFGKLLLSNLFITVYFDDNTVPSFERYEEKIQIVNENKCIMMKYNKNSEEMIFWVPNSNMSAYFWEKPKVLQCVKVSYKYYGPEIE